MAVLSDENGVNICRPKKTCLNAHKNHIVVERGLLQLNTCVISPEQVSPSQILHTAKREDVASYNLWPSHAWDLSGPRPMMAFAAVWRDIFQRAIGQFDHMCFSRYGETIMDHPTLWSFDAVWTWARRQVRTMHIITTSDDTYVRIVWTVQKCESVRIVEVRS